MPPGMHVKGTFPFKSLEVDFTEVMPCQGYKYILFLIYTYLGWVEAYPRRTEKARELARYLLRDIAPQFGLPLIIGSDNGPAFVSKIIQLISKLLGIKWKLHATYWKLHSSRQLKE